jgi:hypothetical protein
VRLGGWHLGRSFPILLLHKGPKGQGLSYGNLLGKLENLKILSTVWGLARPLYRKCRGWTSETFRGIFTVNLQKRLAQQPRPVARYQ